MLLTQTQETVGVQQPVPHQITALDILNNGGSIIAILIAIGTLFGLYRKWRDSENKAVGRNALTAKRVDDQEQAHSELEARVTAVETKVNDQSVKIGRIEARIEAIAQTNERIEKNIDRIFDKLDNISNR